MKTQFVIAAIAASLLLVPAATAQNQSQGAVEANPGLIGAGSALYGLEVAYDNAAMNVGLKKAGEVAQERASEAKQAAENNNTEGVQRAARNLQNVAERAQDTDEEGISKAMAIMNETIANAPNEEARQGMQTALENMKQAQQKREEARQKGNQTDRQQRNGQQGEREERQNRTGDQQDGTQDRQQGGNTSGSDTTDNTSGSNTSETEDGSQQDTQQAP